MVTYVKAMGTKPMRNHLKSCSRGTLKTPSVKAFMKSFNLPAAAKAKLADLIAVWCALDLRPFTVASGDGFTKVATELVRIGALYSNFDVPQLLPSDRTVKRRLTDLATQARNILKNTLEQVRGVSIGIDHWDHDTKKTAFLTITAQWISERRIKNKILGTPEVPDKTANTTWRYLQDTLVEYQIPLG
ncbi:hypothetical protein HDE_13321 [Halotydeus destructor]|nr:hypothetical protein HDE_13321 [Halotydeus destructor]